MVNALVVDVVGRVWNSLSSRGRIGFVIGAVAGATWVLRQDGSSRPARARARKKDDERLDEALEETMDGSDPVSIHIE